MPVQMHEPSVLTKTEWEALAAHDAVRDHFSLREGESGEVLAAVAHGAKFQFVWAGPTICDLFVLVRNATVPPPLVITRGARGALRLRRYNT
jgi:hypothetical protein